LHSREVEQREEVMRTAEIDSRIILAQSKYDDEILEKILGQRLS